MALTYFNDITTVFGGSAGLTGTGATAVLSFKPSETGVNSNFGTPETATAEGLILALLQRLEAQQLITLDRALEITKTAILATKNGAQVNGEQYIIRIFADNGITPLDPDAVRNTSSSSSAG
jgi:hypothetical protein